MIKKNQHVVPVGTKWGVKGEGNSRYTKVTDTQREATSVARSIARNMQSELVIHGKNGWKIRFDLTPLAKVMLTPKNYLFLTL